MPCGLCVGSRLRLAHIKAGGEIRKVKEKFGCHVVRSGYLCYHKATAGMEAGTARSEHLPLFRAVQ